MLSYICVAILVFNPNVSLTLMKFQLMYRDDF